jgi:hypothetical protein
MQWNNRTIVNNAFFMMTGFKITTMFAKILKKMERQEKKDEIITGRSGAAGSRNPSPSPPRGRVVAHRLTQISTDSFILKSHRSHG